MASRPREVQCLSQPGLASQPFHGGPGKLPPYQAVRDPTHMHTACLSPLPKALIPIVACPHFWQRRATLLITKAGASYWESLPVFSIQGVTSIPIQSLLLGCRG